jgi:hypothetical protein
MLPKNYFIQNNLVYLRYNSFQQTVSGAGYTPIVAPSVTVTNITVIPTGLRLTLDSAAGSMFRAGTAVGFTGTIAVGSNTLVVSEPLAVIVAIDPVAGIYADITQLNHTLDGANISTAAVIGGSLTLSAACSTVMFSTPASNTNNVLLADGRNFANTFQGAPIILTPATLGYQFSPINGFGYMFTDFFVSSAAGSQVVYVQVA